jgi:hypothetical protein
LILKTKVILIESNSIKLTPQKLCILGKILWR